MRPARKLACVVLALAVVTSVVYATGAFTTTTASRSADVQVTGDASAFLALQKSNGPNAALASYGSNGALQVTIGGAGSGATGVNPDSQTAFRNVFTITNKGAQPVSVWFTGRSPAVTFTTPDGTSIEGKSGAVTVRPGGQPVHIGLTIDARNVRPGRDLLESVKIRTDATVEGESAKSANNDDKEKSASSGTSRASTGNGGEESSGGETDASTSEGNGKSNDQSNNREDKCGGWLEGACETYHDGVSAADHATGLDEEAHQKKEAAEEYVGEKKKQIINTIKKKIYKKRKKLRKRLTGSIGNVIDFLKEHPALMGVITTVMPQVAIGAWVYEHPAQARAFALGSILGETGMPDGELAVDMSDSPFYIVGWMGVSAIPGVETLADVRDFGQNLYDKDWLEAGLDGMALASYYGYGPTDIVQSVQDLGKWITKAGSKADIVVKTISKYILPHLSDGRKLQVLNIMSNGAATTLKQKGYSMSQITDYAKDGDNLKKIKKLTNTRLTQNELADYLEAGYKPSVIGDLKKKVSPADMRWYYQHNVDFNRALELRNMKVSAENVKWFVKRDTSLPVVEWVGKRGFGPAFMKKYVKGRNNLVVVKKARKRGYKPSFIKTVYKQGRRARRIASVADFYGLAHNYCNWQQQQPNPKYDAQCQKLPTS